LAGSGLDLANGVECDAGGVAAPCVYAVGDVAGWAGRRHEHWTNVSAQANRVAAAILSQPAPGDDVAYWWIDQYDIRLQGLGNPGPDDDVDIVAFGVKARAIALYSQTGRLTGAVGFSAGGGVMRLRSELATGADVAEVRRRLVG
jgi:3-phenylpropionate/trans-cinnamate dioxygenase ferredoxin reductase subunit